MRALSSAILLCLLAACSTEPLPPCPATRTSLDGGCAPVSHRCQWPAADPAFVTYCTCAGTGTAGQWTCADFRRVDRNGCPVGLPTSGERCDLPTAQPCPLNSPDGCRHRCECVPTVGVVTPPRWQCTRACPLDAGVRDAPAG